MIALSVLPCFSSPPLLSQYNLSYLFQMLVSQVAVAVVLGLMILVNRPVTQSVLDTFCSEVFSWGFVAENSISGFKALEKAASIAKTDCSAI